MSISIIVPIFNERDNISRLYWELHKVLPGLDRPYEILFIDDGSTDGSAETLREITTTDPNVRVVELRRNYGQTAAMQAGIDLASGDVIVTMDGDLQNDPCDIPALLNKLDDGFDLVHGRRGNPNILSQVSNWIVSKATAVPNHDLGCGLRAMRQEVASELELCGEMHRFIPILAHHLGAKCAGADTKHHPRTAGKTKYGIMRPIRVLLDLLTVKYLCNYAAQPMKLFGGAGFLCLAAATIIAMLTLGMKLFGGVGMIGNPLLLLSMFTGLAGIQFVGLGLLGEVSVRGYSGNQAKQPYLVRELVNFEEVSVPPLKLQNVA